MNTTKDGGKDTVTKIIGDIGKSEWMIEIEMIIRSPMKKQHRERKLKKNTKQL